MRVVFMGTPEYAATILEEVANHHDVVCAYTRPDAVRGRGSACVVSPVGETAARLGIQVRKPKTLRDEAVVAELRGWDADIFVVAAYGAILPPEVLAIPELGCLNAHASELPRWRGAAPIQRAILAGDAQAGVCVMRMEEGLDTGPYCVSRTTDIADKSAAELTVELADLGARAMLTALSQVEAGCARWTEQDPSRVTYAHKIEKGELDIAPTDSVAQAIRRVQAADDGHPSRAIIGGKGVTVCGLRPLEDAPEQAFDRASSMKQGEVAFVAKRLLLGFSDGAAELFAVKPDGKRLMEGSAFAAGLQGVKKGGITWEREGQ